MLFPHIPCHSERSPARNRHGTRLSGYQIFNAVRIDLCASLHIDFGKVEIMTDKSKLHRLKASPSLPRQ